MNNTVCATLWFKHKCTNQTFFFWLEKILKNCEIHEKNIKFININILWDKKYY